MLAVVARWARENNVAHEAGPGENQVVVSLPGEARLLTTVLIRETRDALAFIAFAVRNPDENHHEVYRYLLDVNRRAHHVTYATGPDGDIYVRAHLPVCGVELETLDQVFGELLGRVDGDFNHLLRLGFASSIKREWAWRISRGESTRNLAAFADLQERDDGSGSPVT